MLKYDFHIHSKYSRDCETPLKEILRAAAERNLNGIAICDHDEIKGALKAFEIVKSNPEKYGGLHVITGTEVSTSKGHILVLGVNEKIPSFMTPEETTDYARDLNAISIVAHPFRKSAHGIGYLEGSGADAAETFNSKCITNSSNRKAKAEAERLGMPQTGGSDAHIAELVGRGYTLVNSDTGATEDVFNAILRGETTPAGEKTPKGIVISQMKKNVVRRARMMMNGNMKEC
ncbi:MAG: PHP domain-containing protein [Methanosarcinales archaeon]|jgi:predicted metal-dependent phosphoesterase TrpH|nr:PHP domain-containing protein [Methanosarcinales archaeon]